MRRPVDAERLRALAKIERGHETDRRDVAQMMARGLVTCEALVEYFTDIEPELFRFPALDPAAFRLAVDAAVAEHCPPAINPLAAPPAD